MLTRAQEHNAFIGLPTKLQKSPVLRRAYNYDRVLWGYSPSSPPRDGFSRYLPEANREGDGPDDPETDGHELPVPIITDKLS